MHSNPRIQWPETIQIAAHNHNTYPSANNGYSLFLLHFGRGDSNPLWNRLNPGNMYILQNDVTASVHELHKLWKAHAKELKRNRSKKDNTNITSDPELHKGDKVIIMNYQPSGLTPRFHGDWKITDFNTERQVVVENPIEDKRVLSTKHVKKASLEDVIFSTCDYFKLSWKL